MDELTKVEVKSMNFDDLMTNIRNGYIRIPNFQRDFVWERSQIISLLDSIYKHFPIGSFLFWHTDDQIQSYRRIGEVELRTDKDKSVKYVLDGQQRLTSLFSSLEQAKIAHKVNGKRVTKNIKIYFDLDEERFVEDPFSKKYFSETYKYENLRTIVSTNDYFRFMVEMLNEISKKKNDESTLFHWVTNKIGVSVGIAKHFNSRFQAMGLYFLKNDICTITDSGLDILKNNSVHPILRSLIYTIKYIEEMLPKIVETGEIEEADLVKYLSDSHGIQVKQYKIGHRLKWLAGLGLGQLNKTKFVISGDGKKIIDEVLREFEIRERDLQEQNIDKENRYFSVRQFTDLGKLLATASGLNPTRLNSLQKVADKFKQYPFSIIHVYEQPIEVACEIFERINTSGMALNLVDLMVAKSWSPSFNMRERLAKFREELLRQHYDDLPDITILQCVAAVIQRGVQRKDILSIDKIEIENKWDEVLESIRKTVDFLKANLKLTSAKILPYYSIMVPLSFFFHRSTTKVKSNAPLKTLIQWFWKASLSNRYDSAAETKIGDDIIEMGKLVAGDQAKFNYVAPPLSADRIIEQKLNLGSAFCKTILCLFNYRGPLEFLDSTPILLTSFSKINAAELHHIFPQDYLKKHDSVHFSLRHSMANIALASSSANKKYFSQPPSKYLTACNNKNLNQALKTHCIVNPKDSGIYDDDFNAFINYRAEEILKEMHQLTGEMTEVEVDFRGKEAKAIEKFELRIRNLVDKVLIKKSSDYWKHTGSIDFRNGVEDRIRGWLKTNPTRKRKDAREIDFCQILDYLKVIKSHWELFEPIFKSKTDLEMHLKNISKFRNYLMHNQEIGLTTTQLALGSLNWFSEIFKATN
jgi:hypothetical protein